MRVGGRYFLTLNGDVMRAGVPSINKPQSSPSLLCCTHGPRSIIKDLHVDVNNLLIVLCGSGWRAWDVHGYDVKG